MSAIAPPRLAIPESLDFAGWYPLRDLELFDDARSPTNVLELERIGPRSTTRGLRVCGPIARGVLEGSDVVALTGGDALVDWVLRDARAPAVRVLAFDADTDTSRLASAPFLAQVRRLILQGKSTLVSPWLGPLEALRLIHPTGTMPMPPRLRELRITGTARAGTLDATFALLRATHLQQLELSDLEVPLDAVAHAELRELSLVDCTLRGTEMLAALPVLEHFVGTRCGLDDDAAFALERSRGLRSLVLGGNDITDAGAAAIATLPQLGSLGLGSTSISDAGVAALVALRELRSLDLSGNKITDAGAAALAGLPPLMQGLDLSNTAVTDAGAAALAALRFMTRLDLRGSKATSVSRDERGFVLV